MIAKKNIYDRIPLTIPGELLEKLVVSDTFSLERILSKGQSTPTGDWYDQDTNEWVILLKGSAGIAFEGEAEIVEMHPGDFVHIPAHRRHRVEWTDREQATVWLALHYK